MKWPALAAMLALSACNSSSQITGLIVGGAAGAATANPAVGYAVGIGTTAATNYALRYIFRTRQHAEQAAIAAAAGPLGPGGEAVWRIRHDIPIGDEGGRVRVVRDIPNLLAACREIVFSIHDDPPAPEAWFATTVCHDGQAWNWAQAEPAVARWGFLQ